LVMRPGVARGLTYTDRPFEVGGAHAQLRDFALTGLRSLVSIFLF
jgi:hypothetical protein